MTDLTWPIHRRELLPLIEARAGDATDERDLATSWVGTRRSLYEVVEVEAGERLELLDLRS